MIDGELPENLINERDSLIAEIEEVFAGVTREGGISWGQATVQSKAHEKWMEENARKPEHLFKGRDITWRQLMSEADDGEDRDEAKEKADLDYQYHDRDGAWRDLVAVPEWVPDPMRGGFSLLDPIGRRYYLPAAMIRSLQEPDCTLLAYQLTVNDFIEGVVAATGDLDWRTYFLDAWSALSARERLTVKHFVRFKMVVEEAHWDAMFAELPSEMATEARESILKLTRRPWSIAYASYWENLDES